MKMAFELNDLKGFLFLVLFTIPSTSATNYDCKGKSFYCLDSKHFLICVDFGDGVLSTIDDFVLPCPSLTECHESNTYECELPKIVTTTTAYATSVTEKSDNSVVPLINTPRTVPPELTTVLPSTEKSTVAPVSEVVTSESNKEILESLKEQFTGGNEHIFKPTKFIPTDSIGLSPNVNRVNATSTTFDKNNNSTANVETSSEKKVNISVKVVPKIIDVTTSFEGLLVTDSNEAKIYIPKSLNITHNNTDKIEVIITTNELTKSKNFTSDGGQNIFPNLSTDGVNVNSVSEASYVESSTNTVPLEVTTIPPSTERNTATTEPFEMTTVKPSTEKNTGISAVGAGAVTFESNKEILEKFKAELTEDNEKKNENTLFVPTSSISLSPSVDKVNKMNTTTDKKFNPKPGIGTSTENTVTMTVTDNSKTIDGTTSVEGLLTKDFKEGNSMSKSRNITHNNTNTRELNKTANELTKSKYLTGDEALPKTLPTSSSNLNTDGIYLITFSEMSDKSVMPPKNTATTGPLKVTTVLPSTEKNTVIPTLEVVTSNKEILDRLKDKFTGGNEKILEPTKFIPTPIISFNPRVDKVSDMSAIADKKNNHKPDISTEDTMKIGRTDSPKNIGVTTSFDGLQDLKNANSQNIVYNITKNKDLNLTVSELLNTKSENLTGYEAGAIILPTASSSNINTDGLNVISSFKTSNNSVVPIQVTTVLPSTDMNTFTPALEVTTSKLNKEILESLKDEFTEGNEEIFKPLTPTVLPSTDKNNFTPALEVTTSKLNRDILESLKDDFAGGNEKIFKVTTDIVPPSTDKNTFTPALEVTTSKIKKENLESLKDEFTGVNEETFKPTSATVLPSTDKNTFTPALEVTTSKLNRNISESLKDDFAGGNEKIFKATIDTVLPSTDKNDFTPALEVTTSKLNKEILESLKDEFFGGNEKTFKPTSATVLPSTDKNTFTPALEVTTTKLNKEILDSMKYEFTGGYEKTFKPTTATVLSAIDKNTFTPALEVTTSKLNEDILESFKDEFTGVNKKIFKPTTTTVLPLTDKNTFTPALEVTISKLNKEILENLKDEFSGGNEKLFKPTTSVLPHSMSLNPSVEMVNEMNITTDININAKESIETSTESTEKIYVTNDPKVKDIGTAVEGILITDFKNTTYTPKLQNVSHTTIDTGKLNITENSTSDKAPTNKFLTLSSNLNSGQRYYLDNIVSFSNQTNYYYSLHNLTTPTLSNEGTLYSSAITEKALHISEMNENQNTNNITDNIGSNVTPEVQEDFLSNQLVQLEKSTTITSFEVSSPTVTPSNHLQIKEPNGSEPFISGTLNNASASTNKYKTINNIDIVYTTFSTTVNIVDNPIEQNLDVLNNNEVNTNRTTVSNNEQTMEVTSTTHKETTPTETQIYVSGDNSLKTPTPTHESMSTTVSTTTIEKSITPLVDSVTTLDINVNQNKTNVLKKGEIKEAPIDIQVKSTTTLSMETSIEVTPSPKSVVTKSTSSNLFSRKESSLEKQINITTSDTIYITAFTTTPQSKTNEIKSEHVNNLIVTTTENVNTKSSKIGGSEDWNNTDLIKANNLSNISSVQIERPYGAKEEKNVTYENADLSAVYTITVSSTTEPNANDQAKKLNKNNVKDSSSVTITSTLSNTHKINVTTEAMYTTSFTINESINNKPTEAPSKLETTTNADTITTSQNINNIKTNVKNLTLIQIKNATPITNTAPNLKTSEVIKELHKGEQLNIFPTTVKPIIEKPLTSENILNVTKLTSFTTQGTENQSHSTTEVTTSVSLKLDYSKIIAKTNIPYRKEGTLTGYLNPDQIILLTTSDTNFGTATSGAGISSETFKKNQINGFNVKETAVVNDSTLKPVTVPVSREMLHSKTTTQLPMEVIKTQTTYHSNTFVSPAVTEFTAEQKPNIVANRIPLAIMASTSKPNIDNSRIISTDQASSSIVNNNTEQTPIMAPVSTVETLYIQRPKSVLGTIFTDSIFNNDNANNFTYSTNPKIRDKSNTTIKAALQTNTQNTQGNNTVTEEINLETTTNALEKALLNVDISVKSENENENNESSTPYESASRIELTTPNSLDYKIKKSVINTSYVTPQSEKSQANNINSSDTQTNEKDNESKTIPAKTKVTRAAIHGNEGKAKHTFDCRNKTRGKYGDSNDCQKFYTCIGTLQPIVEVCPNHTVFSEINKQCTRNLSHCVRNNQFHCLYEGRFSDFFKDNIYYICVKNNFHGFLRYKLQCQGGYYLNKATLKCEKIVEVYKESVSSVSEKSKISNDQNKSTIKSDESEKSVSNDFECKKEGLFPYSSDCRMYYVCSKNSKDEYRRKIKKCSSDEVYDKEKKKCVNADSIEC